ncbi:MAG: PQQ-binding-like beta-propeller repeat protein [Acidobacteriota bacterium]
MTAAFLLVTLMCSFPLASFGESWNRDLGAVGDSAVVEGAVEASAKTIEANTAMAVVSGSWPHFRGPERDGKTPSRIPLLSDWPKAGPPVLWEAPVGPGYSGLAVAENRLFTAYNRGEEEVLVALDAGSGKELWTLTLGKAYTDNMGDGPRATPAIAGSMVYALSARGLVHGVSADSGELRWTVDLIQRFGARFPLGASSQPLVLADRLLVDAGGPEGKSIVALSLANGETLWTAGNDSSGYSQAIPLVIDEVEQAVFFTATKLQSVDPASGEILWERPWKTDWDVNAATPIFVEPNRLFVSSGYDTGSALLEISRSGAIWKVSEVWRSRRLKNQFSSSVLVGDHLYGFDNKIFKCLELSTGRERWKARGFAHGSLVYGDGDLYVLGEEGRLALVEATPESYREKASVEIFNSRTWTPPTLIDGRLFVRDEARLLSLDVRGAS